MKKPPGVDLVERRRRAAELREECRASPARKLVAEGLFAREFIDPKLLMMEPRLRRSRWPEYGYLTPLECTQRFTTAYEREVRRFTEKYYDLGSADAARPVMKDYAANTWLVMSQLWTARQKADDLGMPYDVFLQIMMELKTGKQNYKKVPRPNQIYGEADLAHTAAYWKEFQSEAMLFREEWDERFFAGAFKGDPAQVAALDAMEAKMRAKPGSLERVLGSSLLGHFGRPTITIPEAVRRFGIEVTTRALGRTPTSADLAAIPPGKVGAPSCLGWMPDKVTAECIACPGLSTCQSASAMVRRRTADRFGSADPRGDHRRAKNREDQQKSREKKRARQMPAAESAPVVAQE